MGLCPLPSLAALTMDQLQVGLGMSFMQNDTGQAPLRVSGLSSPVTNQFALLAQASLNSWLWLDVAASYGLVEFVRAYGQNQYIHEQSHRIHFPLLFRASFLKYFSVGAGFYASYLLGGVNSSDVVSTSEQTSAHDPGEHGLEASVALKIPVAEDYFFTLDYRRVYSLTSRSKEGRDWSRWLFFMVKKI